MNIDKYKTKLTKSWLTKNLKVPLIQAPMFIVSTPKMLIDAAKSGVIGTLPSQNAKNSTILEEWIIRIKTELKDYPNAVWGINVITHSSFNRSKNDIAVIVKHKVPIVISALGSPKQLVEQVHTYHGLVFADVINLYFARKASVANVDGLILITTGAGGHTGNLSPFAFIKEVRSFYSGILIVGGAITSGKEIVALQILGADFAYIGTSFIATKEANAKEEYKQMIINANCDDIITSNKITGINANWLKESLAQLPSISVVSSFMALLLKYSIVKKLFSKKLSFKNLDADKVKKRWKDIFSAGQGVGSINKILDTKDLINKVYEEYKEAKIIFKNNI